MENKPHRIRDKLRRRHHSGFYLTGIVIVIVAILSFYGGMNYQKQHLATASTTTSPSATAAKGFSARRYGRLNRIVGQVSAISSTSVSITSQIDGSIKTYSMNSFTKILDSGQAVSSTDIKVGDTIIVSSSYTNSTQALRIVVNPSVGGGTRQATPPPTTSTN